MNTNLQAAMLATGLIASSFVCTAQTDKLISKNAEQDVFLSEKSGHIVSPSEAMRDIFDNLYHQPADDQVVATSWKEYQTKLKALFALNFNDHVQIGLDKFRSGPSKSPKGEIIDINPNLQPRMSDSQRAQGYGVEVRVKLD